MDRDDQEDDLRLLDSEVRGLFSLSPSLSSLLPAGDAATPEMNDSSDADRLRDVLDGNCVYDTDRNEFLFWNGVVWKKSDTWMGEYTEEARKSLLKWIENCTFGEEKTKWMKYYTSTGNSHKIEAMWAQLKHKPGVCISHSSLDRIRGKINTGAGLLELDTGEVITNSKSYLPTMAAKAPSDKDCPIWKNFLNQIFEGDKEVIDYVQKALGYSVSGTMTERLYFTCFGDGRNGKSTFFEIIKGVLGGYCKTVDNSVWASRRDKLESMRALSTLRGARIAVGNESGAMDSVDEAFLKKITGGGEPVIARPMYAPPEEFLPEFTLWIATNHKPRIRNLDQALIDRIRLIPFNLRIKEEDIDKGLSKRIVEKEGGAILSWIVEGYRKYLKEGLRDPEACLAEKNEYITENDEIQRYLDACVAPDVNDVFTSCKTLYASYTQWCASEGRKPLSNVWFSRELKRKGAVPSRKRDDRGVPSNGYMLLLYNQPESDRYFIAD